MVDRAKHLELIQSVIGRMANNSFLLKGWTVTLVGLFIAFAKPGVSSLYIMLAYFPILIFWGLDSYYLWHERLFRLLYADAAKGKAANPYSLDIEPYKTRCKWHQAAKRPVLWVFYVGVSLAVTALVLVHHYG